MIYKTITSSETEKDIERALLRYFEINKNLAKRFLSDVRTTKNAIQKNPNHYQVRYNHTRIAFLNSFPYGYHFKIKNGTITILALFQTYENPDKWSKR